MLHAGRIHKVSTDAPSLEAQSRRFKAAVPLGSAPRRSSAQTDKALGRTDEETQPRRFGRGGTAQPLGALRRADLLNLLDQLGKDDNSF